jgi:hypothetical protein
MQDDHFINRPNQWEFCYDTELQDRTQLHNFAVDLVHELNDNNPFNIINFYIEKDTETQHKSLTLVAHSKEGQGNRRARRFMRRRDNRANDADTDTESRFGLNSHVTTLHKRLLCLESALLYFESASSSTERFLP